jgi:serine/threonine protein kinase/Tol biopolymer transport system component
MIIKALAHYEITSQLGKGGMGEVYRATDKKLGRDVAIKVLPQEFARDADRIARFQREAKLLASLNHPNIAAIYGLEESGGTNFLVMELVEGETLADRIGRGPVPVEESLKLALQIAEALEAAHEKGVIHRDLKPANIKVTPDDKVKVLDFGLAKAFAGEQAELNLSNSPTISQAATQQGVILGTAAYMSPEQARGKPVDKRADIWAFGVVLYEMVTGRKLFEGEDLTETLASVVMKEPDLGGVPSRLRKVLEACLQKDPGKRLHAIGDWKLLLDTGPAENQLRAEARPAGTRLIPWAVAALAIVAAIALWVLWRQAPEEHSQHLSVAVYSQPWFLEISPDGKRLLTVFSQNNLTLIRLRSFDSWDWVPLSYTDAARTPFWSPDSRFIGFFADGKLKTIPAAGGPAKDLCSETGSGYGGTWNREGVILFASDDGKLRRVDKDGGECSLVGNDSPDLVRNSFPTFLPDGNSFLYVRSAVGDPAASGVYLSSLDGLEPHRILADQSSVVYVPPAGSGPAHLLFRRENTLMAQPFDVGRLEPVGDPFRVAGEASDSFNPGQVAASYANGTLVYLAGRPDTSQLTWVNREGEEMGTAGPQVEQYGVSLSLDGNMVLTMRPDSMSLSALWLYDLSRGSDNPLMTQASRPVWFPDGKRALVGMNGSEGIGFYIKDTTGVGQAKLAFQVDSDPRKIPSGFSPDGKYLIFTVVDPQTQADIWYMPWSDNPDWSDAVKLIATDAIESQGQVSPKGKWIAYTKAGPENLSVYISSFPSPDSFTRKVSLGMAMEPRWNADGSELFFRGPRSGKTSEPDEWSLFSASVQPDQSGGLDIGMPQELFLMHSDMIIPEGNTWSYAPSPDGQRFLVNKDTDPGQPTINVITNWRPEPDE